MRAKMEEIKKTLPEGVVVEEALVRSCSAPLRRRPRSVAPAFSIPAPDPDRSDATMGRIRAGANRFRPPSKRDLPNRLIRWPQMVNKL